MEEFKINTKIGQVVTEIKINIRSDADKNNRYALREEGLHIKKHKIIHQSEVKIALNNDYITIFDRDKKGQRKESYRHCIEDLNVSFITNDDLFANGIFGATYTIGNVKSSIKRLTKKMQSEVNNKYGFLVNINIESIVTNFHQRNKLNT